MTSIDRTCRRSPRKGFSLAALLLVIAIIAVCLAMMRAAFNRDWPDELQGTPGHVALVVAVFGLLGGIYATTLAIWSRARWPYWPGAFFGGLILGAGAAAQASLPVAWPLLCVGPAVLILITMLLVPPKKDKNAELAQPPEEPQPKSGV